MSQTPTNVYEVFETDETLEREGVWFDTGVGKYRVAYAGNPDFLRVYEEVMRPVAEADERGYLDEKVKNRLLAQVYARTVVLGWEEVRGRDGEEIPFSVEACEKLLIELPRLLGLIRQWSSTFANYRKQYVEHTAGN